MKNIFNDNFHIKSYTKLNSIENNKFNIYDKINNTNILLSSKYFTIFNNLFEIKNYALKESLNKIINSNCFLFKYNFKNQMNSANKIFDLKYFNNGNFRKQRVLFNHQINNQFNNFKNFNFQNLNPKETKQDKLKEFFYNSRSFY